MYPTGCVPPKFYGLPKIHKPDTPLRPIVSSCRSVTYGVAKELAKILKPLVGKTSHHISSTQAFVEQVKYIILAPGECLSSYDVSALFTLVPVDPVLNIIRDLLENDHTLKDRTVLAVNDIILLLKFCLKDTYFSFWDQFYEQVEGVAWVSPVSSIAANFIWILRTNSFKSCPHPHRFCCRFEDDTFVIHKEVNKQDFLQHINSVDAAIKFTVEDNKDDGSISFLDTIVKPEADGGLSITAYRKPPHTDQYLQWDSHHNLSAKFSCINSLSIGPKLGAAIMSCSNKKRNTSGRFLISLNIPNGLWTRWRKDLTGLPVRRLMGLITKVPQVPILPPMKLKARDTLSYPTHKVFVKSSKTSLVDMASKPTSKVAAPSKTSWSPPRTKTPWSTKVMPSIGMNVGT